MGQATLDGQTNRGLLSTVTPNALYMMGRKDDAIQSVHEVLALGRDLLTHHNFGLLYRDMMRDLQVFQTA